MSDNQKRKNLLLYGVCPVALALCEVAIILFTQSGDALFVGVYALIALFMLLAYRLEEPHIWRLMPAAVLIILAAAVVMTQRAANIGAFSADVSWGQGFVYHLMAFGLSFLMPVIGGIALYSLIPKVRLLVGGQSADMPAAATVLAPAEDTEPEAHEEE